MRLDLSTEEEDSLSPESLCGNGATSGLLEAYEDKEKRFGEPMLRQLEKIIMLQTIDSLWKDHLLNMDHLKEGIGLRGYGQKNPLQEYQKEGFDMFEEMVQRNEEDVVQKLFTVELARETVAPEIEIAATAPATDGAESWRRADVGACRQRGQTRRARRSAATILVHAAAARNTSAVTESNGRD